MRRKAAMTNEQKKQTQHSIHVAQDALQRIVQGQDPHASKLGDRRDFADWELNYLLRNLIPALPADLRADVQACYDLREQVWSDDYREAYYAQQKTSPSCLAASDSL
jgi:hypothetical protein